MAKRKRKGIRLYSFIAPTLVILSVLLLNGLATRIEFPEACKTEPTKYRLNIPGICDEMIDDIAIKCGLDPEIIKAIILEESNGDPNAIGDNGESIGLMQIQPRWHRVEMEELGIVDLFNPQENVILGCTILSKLYEQYGNYTDALSVYNSGNTEDGREYAERILRK